MDHSTNETSDDDIWLTNLDIPMNLQPLSLSTQILRISTISVGFFLNGFLLVVFMGSRQLRYPRHLFWPAVALINFFYLIQCIIEMVAIVHKDRIACQMFVLNAGVGYSLLLLCLALTALDRYLSISHHEWYKRRVTNRVVLITLCGSSAITYIVITSPFWTGYKRISTCTINMTHMNYVLSWDLLLGITCFILHIILYIRSRALIRNCPPQHLKGIPLTYPFRRDTRLSIPENPMDFQGFLGVGNLHSTDQIGPMQNEILDNIEGNDVIMVAQHQSLQRPDPVAVNDKSSTADVNKKKNKCFSWLRMSSNKVNTLEIRAAITMSVNILPFWVCTFPVSCNVIALYWCILFKYDCSIIFTINPYLRNMFLFHGIYNPLMYMVTSREFRQALSHFLKKRSTDRICCPVKRRPTIRHKPKNLRMRY